MSFKNTVIGKIFISYSHTDKRFVRRLAKQLELNGYSVWLDEKELVAGDPLSQSISEALTTAKVVLVVASANALKSRWLKYEVNNATERMVLGQCRVIPIVIDDSKLPPEVGGLLYADFRGSFKHGMNSILTALSHEVANLPTPFYQIMDDAVKNIFGPIGYVSILSSYSAAGEDWESVRINIPGDGSEVIAVYDTVPDYGHRQEPMDDRFWSEYTYVNAQRDETFFILVSEKPIGLKLDFVYDAEPKIGVKSFRSVSNDIETCWVVVVDMSSTKVSEEQYQVLRHAKDCLVQLAQNTNLDSE